MRPVRLHVKVTILTTGITVIILALMVSIITAKVTRIIVQEQHERAELTAINLAAEIGRQERPHDPDRLSREIAIIRNLKRNYTAVRIYQLIDNNLVETAITESSNHTEPLDVRESLAIRRGLVLRSDQLDSAGATENDQFRVLAPIKSALFGNKVIGAVEVIVTLQPALTTIEQFSKYIFILIFMALLLTVLSSYAMMRYFVYLPVQKLLQAMQQAESGDFTVKLMPRAPDELGILAIGFNRMLEKIATLSAERERQHEHLTEEVGKARQELWTLTRQMSAMERLAVAGQTAAQFAHEVGTPLHIINGHIQLLSTRLSEDTKATNRLQIIIEQIKRIETIVRSMLDRTRMPVANKTTIMVNDIVEQIYEAVAPTVAAREINFERQLAAELPPIEGDPERLKQTLLNLLNNAMDATNKGGSIKVSTSTDQTHVIIEVSDTGAGMLPEVATHIFDPLYTTKERGKGTGLGLVIVQQAVREHNGQIDFKTEVGKGTTFKISLPVVAPELSSSPSPLLLTGAQKELS